MHLLFGVENPASVVKDQPIKQITGILPAVRILFLYFHILYTLFISW
jgi:hypothetical protein